MSSRLAVQQFKECMCGILLSNASRHITVGALGWAGPREEIPRKRRPQSQRQMFAERGI